MSKAESQKQIAQKNWELTNKVEVINAVDEIYRYDKKQQQDILAAKPWDKEYINILILTGSSLIRLFQPPFLQRD